MKRQGIAGKARSYMKRQGIAGKARSYPR